MAEGEAWERLGSERLMETPYFSLRSDRLRLPTGAVKDPYYVIERPDAAIIFPLTVGGEVILVRQYRPPLERMELGLPAGLVEGGEKPEAAARRELLEETGYAAEEWLPLGGFANDGNRGFGVGHFFLARRARQVAAPDAGDLEELAIGLLPLDELARAALAGEVGVLSSAAAIGLAVVAHRAVG